ncbi:MAG: hypothetical protein ACTSVY_09370 [Candidatus Helarchaeota archaeon]
MSKDFANFMESIKEEPFEEQLNEFSDILTKVMAIVVSAIDDMTQRMSTLEQMLNANTSEINALKTNMTNLQQRAIAAPVDSSGQPQLLGNAPNMKAPAPPPPPKPKPKPLSPLSARSAINSELKALFSKRRR